MITLKGNFSWAETTVGQVAKVMCQQQPPGRRRGLPALARRKWYVFTKTCGISPK
jgi:hypothetical protein